MKKTVIILILLIILLAAGWAASFGWKNFRGIGPIFRQPPEDITEVINTTGMPLKLPAGFSISVFAKNLGNPRVLAFDPQENLVVSIPSQGKIVALPDKNKDGIADETITILEGLNRPHGIAFRCTERCEMYVAESHRVMVYEYNQPFQAKNGRKIIDLPGGGNHFTRTILFMPEPNDPRLLVSVGSSCNVCQESDWRRAKILVANADGSDLKIFARGLRNSVFMALHPATKEIWATEMGRDLLGDNLPPDEINIISENKNYGWPICYGKNIHDSVFDKNTYIRNPCLEPFELSSKIDIPAHSAPLGLAFFSDEWPEEYRDDLLVAYHGSWNRSEPTGYKIVRFPLDEKGNQTGPAEDFISGWLPVGSSQGALGRPVDIFMKDKGKIYISDDKAGVVYLVTYMWGS